MLREARSTPVASNIDASRSNKPKINDQMNLSKMMFIDVKFASAIKNINLLLPLHQCVSKNIQAYYLVEIGTHNLMTFAILEKCLTN